MGNYHSDNPFEILEQLQKWMQGNIYAATIVGNVCCYIIKCEEKYFYREIDITANRLFSALIPSPASAAAEDELAHDVLSVPMPTYYMAQALKRMGVI